MKPSSLEIERKFLPKELPEEFKCFSPNEIEQGYLAVGRDKSHVRLRRQGRACSLTFKRGYAPKREEREIQLNRAQFETLWPATAGRRLTKVRYNLRWRKHTIEIDVYGGSNDGLIVAEVEFPDAKSCRAFRPPKWLGKEVTGVPRYSNTSLARD